MKYCTVMFFAYKLLQQTNELDAIGPILIGMRKSLHVLQLGASVREIISMIKIAVIDAQSQDKWFLDSTAASSKKTQPTC